MIDVRGLDRATECYRVTTEVDGKRVTALVPERLASDLRVIGARPSHQEAYVWIAAHQAKIEAAIAKLARGSGRVKPPFDQITLTEDI